MPPRERGRTTRSLLNAPPHVGVCAGQPREDWEKCASSPTRGARTGRWLSGRDRPDPQPGRHGRWPPSPCCFGPPRQTAHMNLARNASALGKETLRRAPQNPRPGRHPQVRRGSARTSRGRSGCLSSGVALSDRSGSKKKNHLDDSPFTRALSGF